LECGALKVRSWLALLAEDSVRVNRVVGDGAGDITTGLHMPRLQRAY